MKSPEDRPEVADPFSREVLEFPAVVELLRGFLAGPISEPRLASLAPHTRVDEIRRDLERVGEAREFLHESTRPSLGSLKDPRSTFDQLAVEGVACTALEILAIVEVARAASDLRATFLMSPFTRLRELMGGVGDFRGLVAELEGKILPDGSVDSSASPALARIRRTMDRLRQQVQSTLEKLLRRLSRDRVLQDAVVTIRNERFVIPIRVEEKRRVAGVVHGASSSGATVYLEPLETLPLNNELVELQEREFAEIQRILAEFTAKLRARRAELKSATEVLSELDLAFAKAEFALHYDGCLPQFGSARALLLKDVRHPLLEKPLRSQGRRPVPLTVEFGEPETLMVLSGPNTGGKTVALKTVGVAVLMAQAGLPVAASEARLPVFGRVLADIGDPQSIEANVSTFSGHVTNIQSMVAVADRNDLVLLDEIGASTEPNEGAALAVAILEHFRERGAMTLVTTHHSRLKAYAAQTAEAVNAAMEFDEATLRPTYRLLIGLPGKSSGLDIASRLGLELSIVEKARTLLNPAEAEVSALLATLHEQKAAFEQQIGRLQAQRKELEAREAQLERDFERERKAKLHQLDARLEETLRRYEKRWVDTVAEIRAQAQSTKVGKRIERKAEAVKREVREEWNAQVLEVLGEPAAPEETEVDVLPAVGDRVRLGNFSTSATVTALLDDGRVEVEMGRLRMRVHKGEVRVLARGKAPAPGPRAIIHTSGDRSGEASAEINVIGSTAEEARERVDKFLDQAFVAGRFRLRIIHGHGKGILKKCLHEMFASHPHVEKFYPAPPQEGGAGATIVELKS